MKRIIIFQTCLNEKLFSKPGIIISWFMLFLFSFSFIYAQAPDKISYQAILRDSNNKLVTDTQVSLRFSILQGATDGSAVYVETQTPTTNGNGLITVKIGDGTVISGDISAIDWSAGPYFLKTEVDPTGGTGYTITGTTQILSVPYALFAKKAANAFSGDYNDLFNAPVNVSAFKNDAGYLTTETDGDTTNELQVLNISQDTLFLSKGGSVVLPPDKDFSRSGNFVTTLDSVGIGTDTPHSILEVHGRITQSGLYGSVVIGENAGINLASISNNNTLINNTLIGNQAGYKLRLGTCNVALGTSAMKYSDTASMNTAIGESALANCNGVYNTACGYAALESDTSGNQNTAMGAYALAKNTRGWYNTASGYNSLYFNTTGFDNTAMGARALLSNSTGHENTAVGAHSLAANTTGNYNTAMGDKALINNTTASFNTAVGYQSLSANTTGWWNTATGYRSLYSNTTGAGNTATGYRALASNSTGNNNTATGYYALGLNTTGHDNTAMGNWALYFNTEGYNNTAVGNYALYRNNTGNNNVTIGDSSLYNNTGNQNTAVGKSALVANTTGNYNIAVGYRVLYKNKVTSANVAIGYESMFNYGDLNTWAGYNTAVGINALNALKTGSGNTAVGCGADVSGSSNLGTVDNSTAIGAHATITASNQVRIGDKLVTSIGGYAGWSNLSDGRFKTEIKAGVPGLAFIMKLRPVMYHLDLDKLNSFLQVPDSRRDREKEMKREQMTETGFIAQEVEKAAQEIGFDFSGIDPPKNEHDYYNLRYAEFVVPLVKAVQEQQAEIETLKEQNKLLQQQIDVLKNK